MGNQTFASNSYGRNSTNLCQGELRVNVSLKANIWEMNLMNFLKIGVDSLPMANNSIVSVSRINRLS